MKNKLEKFLINRGAYERFKTNLKKLSIYEPDDYLQKYSHRSNAISNSFSWSSSPEFVDYWLRISDEWVKIYDNQNLI